MRHDYGISSVIKFARVAVAATLLAAAPAALAKPLPVEKDEITLGFIKLTDMAPLAVAYELGYFEDEGLYVKLEPQANWKVLLDRVLTGELDGAHMLAGQPLGTTIGYGTKGEMITSFFMGLNGNGITVSNEVWQQMKANVPKGKDGKPVHPIKPSVLKPVIAKYQAAGKQLKMGIVFPVSTHNYQLRYWLAAGGINPGYYAPGDISGQIGAEAFLTVTPPPQMPATMEAGTISGYCVGEPWNQQAVFKGIGVPVATNDEIWKNSPDKIFGVTKAWADKHPNTNLAILKALIRAAIWLDANNNANRKKAVEILARPDYVGADPAVIANSMTGTFEFEKGDKRAIPEFNVFFRHFANYPYYSDGIWYLTQMRRWGQIAETKPDSWYVETAKKVYRPDLYLKAAKLLVEEGKAKKEDFPWDSDGFKKPQSEFIDGFTYDGRKPNEYLDKFPIGLKKAQKVVNGKVVAQ